MYRYKMSSWSVYHSCGWFIAVVEIADALVVDTTSFSVAVVVAIIVVGA